MRYCLAKVAENPDGKDYCCGSYPQDTGHFSCWLIADETEGISFNRGAHKAIMIGNRDFQRSLYNFTMTGYVDLGFNEISASTGPNDTITEVEINVYPDGQTATQLLIDTSYDQNFGPRDFRPIEDSFFVLPQTEDAYAEIKLTGNFATEKAGAVKGRFASNNIRFNENIEGVGYSFFGFGDAATDPITPDN